MKRTLTLIMLLAATIGYAQTATTLGHVNTRPHLTQLTQPRTRWSGVINNITTSNVPQTTLIVAPTTGQYELHVNAVVTQHDALGHSATVVTFNYYDAAGIEIITLPTLLGNAAPPNAETSFVVPLVTAKGSPITITINRDGQDLSIDAVYWTLDLLQPLATF
jgi:hypothetical protein